MAFISAAVFGHAMWSFLPSGQESVRFGVSVVLAIGTAVVDVVLVVVFDDERIAELNVAAVTLGVAAVVFVAVVTLDVVLLGVVRVEVADVIVVTVSVDGAAVLEVEVEVEEEEEGAVSNCGFRTSSSLCSQKSPTYPSMH